APSAKRHPTLPFGIDHDAASRNEPVDEPEFGTRLCCITICMIRAIGNSPRLCFTAVVGKYIIVVADSMAAQCTEAYVHRRRTATDTRRGSKRGPTNIPSFSVARHD